MIEVSVLQAGEVHMRAAKLARIAFAAAVIFISLGDVSQVEANAATVRIENPRQNETLVLGVHELKSLGWESLTTATPWDQKVVSFGGVPLAKVLRYAGVRSDIVQAIALNDYRADLDVSKAESWDAFLACEIDGMPISVREKGPCWIVFPWSRRPELVNGDVMAVSVWQLHVLRAQ
ncbi:molybdopterin-dependent oxidoreductase [Lutibaculum baratangense]|uniref:Oxidoreductase molybdopterin-binding domain-containing protein n=1 Tax=Lutibaculum baratangense AMV1 TaxID=631454 RepID=V4RCH5_9HYPH|nr:molybdopterin-dependent oxidoreductase [Lutibaculum baratangense]ESR23094.1 hypothetical protein N177_3162 [Lutibaculum baratangense AMV1]